MWIELVRNREVTGVTLARIADDDLVIDYLAGHKISGITAQCFGDTQCRLWIRLDLRWVGVAIRVDRRSGTTVTGLLLIALFGVVSNRGCEAARRETIGKVKSGRQAGMAWWMRIARSGAAVNSDALNGGLNITDVTGLPIARTMESGRQGKRRIGRRLQGGYRVGNAANVGRGS